MSEQGYYFEKAICDHYKDLCGFVYNKFVKDMQVARDIVQETFTATLAKKVDFSMKGIRAYLFKAVKNDCLDYLKKVKTEKSNITRYLRENLGPESDSSEAEVERLLFVFIGKLPLIQQQTLYGLLKGKTIKQLAKERGVSEQTVKNNRQLAVTALRKMFRESGKKTSPRRKKT